MLYASKAAEENGWQNIKLDLILSESSENIRVWKLPAKLRSATDWTDPRTLRSTLLSHYGFESFNYISK